MADLADVINLTDIHPGAGSSELPARSACVFDLLIFLAYFTIPAQLYWYLKDIPQSKAVLKIRLHFILFIVCCGLSHLFSAIVMMGLIQSTALLLFGKGITAAVSIKTCHLLSLHAEEVIWLFSRSQKLESYVDELEKANGELDELREAAEVSARTSNDILASVSNDIRVPIQAVKEAIEVTLMEGTNTKQHSLLINAHGHATMLQSAVSNVLQFVRLMQHTVSLNRSACQISWILEQAMDISQIAVSKNDMRGVIPCMEISPDAPALVFTDERQIILALRCVVENAIKYTESGHVVLRVFRRHRDDASGLSGPQALQAFTHDALKKADELRVRLFSKSNANSVSNSVTSVGGSLSENGSVTTILENREYLGSDSLLGQGSSMMMDDAPVASNSDLVFQVVDEGVGIPASKKATIFDELQCNEQIKAAAGKKEKQGGGLGMGLVLCAKVMHHLGGRVEVMDNNFLGHCRGTIFELTLPDYAVTPQIGTSCVISRNGEHDTLLPRSALAALRVIVATEDPVFQRCMESLLRHLGVQAISICNRTDAVLSQNMDGSLAFLAPDVLADTGWSNRWSEWKFSKIGREIVAVVSPSRGMDGENCQPEASAVPLALVAASCFLMPHPVHPSALAEVLSNSVNAKGGNNAVRRQSRSSENGDGTISTGDVNIMIVDDSKVNLKVTERMVKRFVESPCIVTAENGLMAVNSWKESSGQGQPYNLILMDLNMPVLDGIGATDQLRKQPGGDKPFIVALTSDFVTVRYTNFLKGQGFDSVLTKPLTMSALRDVVAKATKRIH